MLQTPAATCFVFSTVGLHISQHSKAALSPQVPGRTPELESGAGAPLAACPSSARRIQQALGGLCSPAHLEAGSRLILSPFLSQRGLEKRWWVTLPPAGILMWPGRLLPMSPLPFLRGKKTDTQLPRAPQNTDSITQPPRKGVLHMTEFWLMRSKQQWDGRGVGSRGGGGGGVGLWGCTREAFFNEKDTFPLSSWL